MTDYSKTIIIKIGGSYVTEKEGEDGLPKFENLRQFCHILAEYKQRHPTQPIILAHGAGSFGHKPAAQYSLQHGFHPVGITECGMNMQQLSYIICKELQDVHLNVLPVHPLNCIICENKRIKTFFFEANGIINNNKDETNGKTISSASPSNDL